MTHQHDFTGKTVLITGSSRGLGWAYASAFLDLGARVILHGSAPESLELVRTSLTSRDPSQWTTTSFNVADAAAVEHGIEELEAAGFTPDILVNNAGVQRRGNILDLPTADWDDVIGVNLSGAYYVAAAAGRRMRTNGGGKIINIGSVTTKRARNNVVPYTAAKTGLHGLTQGMAVDLAQWNIQVNTLSPGYFATEMNAALIVDNDFNAWLRSRTPADRWGEPEELIGALLFLASDSSTFVTGQNVFVDGGMTSAL
ncbi:SDR family oxidoreductase [Ruania rhizosphaerae]|uniref:SDR family oxidoreductase n=1 Tax=Ruania rhizosphaerae TaxID=1840413 RepID=UPI0013572F3F|nr:SDR family oxidoreductase [Ruania rhizosphaerae]